MTHHAARLDADLNRPTPRGRDTPILRQTIGQHRSALAPCLRTPAPKRAREHSDQPANSAVRRFGRRSFPTRRYWLGGMSTAGRLGAAPSQREPRRYDLAVTALGALRARRASSVSRASVPALTREQVSRSAWRET